MPQKLQTVFGRILRSRREEAGLTQEVIAHEAGISRNYVGMLERGERTPTIIAVRQLALALGTTMTSLIQELEEMLGSQGKAQKPPNKKT